MLELPTRYYMLVSSLPHLPRLGEAERLPINEARLEARLRMLRPEHLEIVGWLRGFFEWQNQSADLDDAKVAEIYADYIRRSPHPAVLPVIEYRMNMRTLLAALRRRRQFGKVPPVDEAWGAGPWVRHIEEHWSEPDFRLGEVFPWLPRIRELYEKGESLLLEEYILGLVWDRLDRHAHGKPFEFEAVIAFLCKWDMLRRWLSYREDAARAEFEKTAAGLYPTALDPVSTAAS